MGKIISQRDRWIIRRDDGKILCGLARAYEFKAPEDVKGAAIKTYRSKKQALAAFESSWGKTNFEFEAVKLRETLEILE